MAHGPAPICGPASRRGTPPRNPPTPPAPATLLVGLRWSRGLRHTVREALQFACTASATIFIVTFVGACCFRVCGVASSSANWPQGQFRDDPAPGLAGGPAASHCAIFLFCQMLSNSLPPPRCRGHASNPLNNLIHSSGIELRNSHKNRSSHIYINK